MTTPTYDSDQAKAPDVSDEVRVVLAPTAGGTGLPVAVLDGIDRLRRADRNRHTTDLWAPLQRVVLQNRATAQLESFPYLYQALCRQFAVELATAGPLGAALDAQAWVAANCTFDHYEPGDGMPGVEYGVCGKRVCVAFGTKREGRLFWFEADSTCVPYNDELDHDFSCRIEADPDGKETQLLEYETLLEEEEDDTESNKPTFLQRYPLPEPTLRRRWWKPQSETSARLAGADMTAAWKRADPDAEWGCPQRFAIMLIALTMCFVVEERVVLSWIGSETDL
ncbi:hypothetical protein HKX48_008075 [Thoreauomyces humboldtii]|nr:hypothetical protein HKX48_008075 [Thoreauomyces humboldtii]